MFGGYRLDQLPLMGGVSLGQRDAAMSDGIGKPMAGRPVTFISGVLAYGYLRMAAGSWGWRKVIHALKRQVVSQVTAGAGKLEAQKLAAGAVAAAPVL